MGIHLVIEAATLLNVNQHCHQVAKHLTCATLLVITAARASAREISFWPPFGRVPVHNTWDIMFSPAPALQRNRNQAAKWKESGYDK